MDAVPIPLTEKVPPMGYVPPYVPPPDWKPGEPLFAGEPIKPAPAPPAVAPAPVVAAKASALRSVHVDGALYVAIGFLTALLVCLSTDGAAKNVSAPILWWLQTVAESANGGLLALKMFRSTSFADSKAK